MQKFKVTGMSCAACSARVQSAVEAVAGARNVSVNLLTGDLSVDGDVPKEQIIAAVINAGYGIDEGEEQGTKNAEYETIKRRLIFSVIILAVLMCFSMFHTMFSLPLPKILTENPVVIAVIQAALALGVMVINRKFFINGANGVKNLAPNMDTLVALGSGVSYLYSLYVLISGGTSVNLHGLYFESSAMILTLITVGKMLESRAKGKTTDAINSLKEMMPQTATVLRDGKEISISVSKLVSGDVFIVKPGESIPCDGVVISGGGAVDESAITGESIPSQKQEGSAVTGATLNKNGLLTCRATAVGSESIFSKIIQTVTDANATKAPIARLSDKVAGIFVPAVILISVITLIVWLALGKDLSFALTSAVAVLVISCPCALGLATPVTIMVASGVAAKHGVLYKTAASLEMCGRIKTVVLDKTGTLTNGTPSVTDIVSENSELLLKYAYTLEKSSSHPLSIAVCEYAESKGVTALEFSDFEEISGKGVTAVINGEKCFAESAFSAEYADNIDDTLKKAATKAAMHGKTPLIFFKGKEPLGIISVADTLKADSAAAVARLKNMGIKTVMLTGDNKKTAEYVAKAAGIDDVTAGVLPGEKAQEVRKIMQSSRTAMVGDGINDAPALTVADVGMAIGGGKDIAADSADVVLMKNSLWGVVNAIALGRKALLNIKENLFWAFIYNVIGIPIAAGVFYSAFGWQLSPMLGAAAMSLSSFCVVSNALRINLFKTLKPEENKMEKVIKIEGMMCPHCEAHVKEALLTLPQVADAQVSHESGTAKLTLNSDVENSVLTETVEKQGYKVLGIE